MKRCPQCDFLYEDDQPRCDMDGAELVDDPRAVPDVFSPQARPIKQPRRKHFLVYAIYGILLGLALLFFYGFTRRIASHKTRSAPVQQQPALVPSPANTGEITSGDPAPNTANSSETIAGKALGSVPGGRRNKREQRAEASRSSAPATPSRSNQLSTTNREDKKSKPESVSPNGPAKESRVGSILKKTARFLKKPFKL